MPPLGPAEREHLEWLRSPEGEDTAREIVEALRLFTLKIAWGLGLLGSGGACDEETVLEVALELLADVLSEEPRNRWDSDQRPLLSFLMMAVAGDLKNLRGSYPVRMRMPAEDRDGNSRLSGTADPSLDPEEWLEAMESREAIADFVQRIRDHLATTDGLLRVFDLRCQGATGEQIAKELGVDVDTVYQKMNRKLKRVLIREFGVEARILFALDDGPGEEGSE